MTRGISSTLKGRGDVTQQCQMLQVKGRLEEEEFVALGPACRNTYVSLPKLKDKCLPEDTVSCKHSSLSHDLAQNL